MTAKADRELLELAAKAAENGAYWNTSAKIFMVPNGKEAWHKPWNPLTNDGDALRLAVKLGIDLTLHGATFTHPYVHSEINPSYAINGDSWFECQPDDGDILAATRLAIVRAAAAIGETL